MSTPAKIQAVAELTEKLERVELLVVADYRGLTVSEMGDLRKAVREKGGEVIVAKNTLTLIAARNSGREQIEEFLDGPTLLTFSYEDIPGVAKAINDYFKDSKKNISIKGGLLGSQLIRGEQLEQIAKMPTREESIAKIMGGIQAPASRIVGSLNGVMRNIAYILKAYSEKDSGSAA